ncbi:hypothetical protein SDC9_03886 [bioreactor metagenome]|uniref:Uncharacterized protein n=1 Tax=bioreactor metagenome TaxID=1076179 RepID=A0A644SUQ2_9ZZZZ
MKLFRNGLLLVIIMWALGTMSVQAMTPLRVAVLPLMNTAHYRCSEDIKIIQDTIKQPFKYPYYSLLSPEITAAASQAFLTDSKLAKLTDKTAMAEIADKLSADIVIVVELSQASFWEFSGFWLEENYVESGIVLKCYAYSAVDKKYHVIKATRFEVEPYTVNTTAAVFFKELTDQILVDLPYKRIPTHNQELSTDVR